MSTTNRYTQGVRDRAVKMVLDHENEYDSQWAAIKSISEKIGCAAETPGESTPEVLMLEK